MRANAANERLRRALDAAGYSIEQLASEVGYHPKQVGRWLRAGSVPRRAGAKAEIAEVLGVAEEDIWPAMVHTSSSTGPAVDVFEERAAVPRETWISLIDGATEHVELLAFAATFFHQLTGRIADLLAAAAGRGAHVRLCFAHPEGDILARREDEEHRLDTGLLATKVRTSLGYFRPLVDVDGCEIRLHDSTVYASLFRFDDDLMANPHIHGAPASANPLLHLRRDDAGHLFDAYVASIEDVWTSAKPWDGGPV